MPDEPPKSAEVAVSDNPAPEEWISGIPLFMVISGVTLVVFLMLLDTSIVATVRLPAGFYTPRLIIPGCPKNYQPLSLVARCGLVWQCVHTC
jgi:hypothetical protein